ncbi:hypothetical protein NEF87_001399 [Candidatus Lokiarchaeum ossiferum]|uniref:Uncharacterized protein n=1 Tax=Candidatus Lokiarchaeum ossiferum TaxID=2951803 RepID=A0ABY6HNM2_9ARCH|nr:hypothetical protein NEF87_001399 [Candidatus Lokiarchaeum sp. B-35]
MVLKLQWNRGKSFGLALIYLGIMGLLQIIFIAIGQYGMHIGSRPIVILIPIGIILATFYSLIVLFESTTSVVDFRKIHQSVSKKSKKKTTQKPGFKGFINNIYVKPVLMIIVVFSVLFGIAYLISFSWTEQASTFAIADNVAGFGVIIFANYMEVSTKRKAR